jgi:hypothetical protein
MHEIHQSRREMPLEKIARIVATERLNPPRFRVCCLERRKIHAERTRLVRLRQDMKRRAPKGGECRAGVIPRPAGEIIE